MKLRSIFGSGGGQLTPDLENGGTADAKNKRVDGLLDGMIPRKEANIYLQLRIIALVIPDTPPSSPLMIPFSSPAASPGSEPGFFSSNKTDSPSLKAG